MTTFQRARSEEQRLARRQTILQTAAAMLAEMPVSAMSLNELSRRVGLAKSNVLRYFETREAVLLDLLDQSARDFLTEAGEQLRSLVDARDPLDVRTDAVASGLAASFAARPMLCELLSAQAGVLEHNISIEVATRYKEGARDSLLGLAELLRRLFPELDQPRSEQGANLIIVLVCSLWTHTHPAPAVRAVYDADPSFAFMDSNFPDALHQTLYILLTGLLVRS
ncbi:TetR family transcriptional regulator (plasmid) [Streptomyces sp. NBC_01340]|uniref:TetR/AcrR family transcriptional regulator n=1 Tax=unclassified Streptomyces TaxID=2593676 RepID=UPI002251AC1E|nr:MULTISPECIES: TetR family transcriptional regulator [unclassified Streptomyces]MCX4460324.1 TetR family transcriptional regulator [Streptomyces sp. NBC_01719]MCX4500345.1 TetR family transcriptional regulator [Streptomyces sp. NBC_01728]MCX4598048.1 TetR family transcriptional regulator [Streptomyces sp. NBC_01549]WSI45396.1 TetR family transcriptional regulator [Streptomyces sp. NBC_01340]